MKGQLKMSNESVTVKSGLDSAVDYYIQSVGDSLKVNGIEFTHEKKSNVIGCLQKVYDLLSSSNLKFNDLDKSSFKSTLLQVVNYNLNPYAIPAETYFKLVKVYPKHYDRDQKRMITDYSNVLLQVQIGVQGTGYEKLVSRMGYNVKKVCQPWIIREGDEFTYPHFKGDQTTPPEWTPKGNGKVIRVLYVIKNDDDTYSYYWADRSSVKANLLSAIKNNIINDRDDAKGKDWAQKRDDNKAAWDSIQEKTKDMTVDQILADKEICQVGKVSPAWIGPSSEQMFITKMKNNALKTVPKDWAKGSEEDKEILTEEPDEDNDEEHTPVQVVDATANVNTEADSQSKKEIDSGSATVKEKVPEAFSEEKKTEPVPVKKELKEEPKKQEEKNDDIPDFDSVVDDVYSKDDSKKESKDDDKDDPSDDPEEMPF
jgi:hypothetical protein